jgi:hypothetical protein
MITLKEWMETVRYRITEGSNYMWNCYGAGAYALDSWDGDHDGCSFTVIFDTNTQTVYEVQAHDFRNQRAYRLINPDYVEAHRAESKSRGVSANEAWDTVEYTTLEVEEDWLEKAQAIYAGEDYSTDVSIPLDLTDAEMLVLFKGAHEAGKTFNQHVNDILREALENEEFVQGLKHAHGK